MQWREESLVKVSYELFYLARRTIAGKAKRILKTFDELFGAPIEGVQLFWDPAASDGRPLNGRTVSSLV
jgi:hypothetical protein